MGQPPVGQPPVYGGQFPPQQPWAPPPPPKSGSKVGLVIGGVVLALVVGFVALIALVPDEEPATPANQTAQTNPPAEPTKPAPNPPAQEQAQKPTQQQTEPAQQNLGLRQIAQGRVEAGFYAFDWHSSGILTLGWQEGSDVSLTLYDFVGGKFQPGVEIKSPMGGMRDLTYGNIFNDGKQRAILTTESGLLLVDADGKMQTVDGTGIERVYVGDWDGDGQQETLIVMTVDGKQVGVVSRYFVDKDAERLGVWDVKDFPAWATQTQIGVNKRRVLLGINELDSNSKEVVLYTIDPAKGLERTRAQQVNSLWSSPLIGAGAALLGGKPTVVLTYQGNPSYIELLDINESGYASRGKMMLPDGAVYYPVIGFFSGSSQLELLVLSPEGQWYLYGF
ncbi:MAG: hypothetical protein ACOY94_11110 [Bacillota bacterium]